MVVMCVNLLFVHLSANYLDNLPQSAIKILYAPYIYIIYK